ncbi:MAG: HAD hydrolase family protein [Candidatus Lokiarchaeota archaeon]|nr:HAD hydrolase family protein [Candidatus Lokiarchaeota archaeon]
MTAHNAGDGIQCIYLDFDGVLSPAMPGDALDLDLLHLVRDLNQRSRAGGAAPFVAINSGRPESFIEAHTQAFDIKEYCVFENGAGIFRFPSNAIEMHLDPRIPASIHDDFLSMAKLVKEAFGLFRQPNKEYNLTYLFPENDERIEAVARYLEGHCKAQQMPYYVDHGINFINVIVAGTDKGTGLQLAAARGGFDLSRVAGVGDSDSDLPFLELCGVTACPSNGSPGLKARVDYVSPFPHAKGTIDIITRLLDGRIEPRGRPPLRPS